MAAAIPRHLLETLVNCPSCFQRYTDPRVLPTCGHTLCSICLENEWSDKYKHFCPVKTCRKEISLTINHFTDLPLNQTVLDLIKSCNFHVEATGQCQVCNQSPSFVKCSHCSSFVCFECANQHRREALTSLTNNINTLEQDYLNMNDHINHARDKLIQTRQTSLDTLRDYYTRLIDDLHRAQITNEDTVERQAMTWNNELELTINDYKQRCEQIYAAIQQLRMTITDWSTFEQFKQLHANFNQVKDTIREANESFFQHLPAMNVFDVVDHEHEKKKKKINQVDSPSQTDELILTNGKHHLSILPSSIRVQHLDDSTSSASSSSNNEPINAPKHSNGNGKANHHKSLNTLNGTTHPKLPLQSPRRSHRPVSNASLAKPMSNSIADLSLAVHNPKLSSNTHRPPSFQSKLDNYNNEFYKKIPLSQSYDWGLLAITNSNSILLYNKDKSSLIIYDAHGNENERIQWSDGEIKDLCIYHDDSIIIIGEHKQTSSKAAECKLFVCNLTRKQLERERVVERGLNFQRAVADGKLIFYGSEKGCNKSKVSVFDQELQLQTTFECGVEIRSLAVDMQCCYVLGKRRERESSRYFLEKRQKNGQLIRRMDLYELNVDNVNRLIIDSINGGVLVTDGGNKKIWAIGAEGEKKSIQCRPWPWSLGFLTTDVLIILHVGCLTFHAVNPHKQTSNGTKVTNPEKA